VCAFDATNRGRPKKKRSRKGNEKANRSCCCAYGGRDRGRPVLRSEFWRTFCARPVATSMLKLIDQPNLNVYRPEGINLRSAASPPNFALPRNVVSQGVLANLKYVFTARVERIPSSAQASTLLAQRFRTTFIENLKECFRPAPKSSRDAESCLLGMASPGIRIESRPLYVSLLLNIRDLILPTKLPPLELSSQPVEVPEIWSKHKGLSAANLTSVTLHLSLTALVLVLTVQHATTIEARKPATVLIAAPPLPGAAPRASPVATPAPVPRVPHLKRKSFFVQGKLTAPVAIPKVAVAKRNGDDTGAPDLIEGGSPAGLPGGVLGGQIGGMPGGVLGGVLGGAPGSPAPPVAEASKSGILRIGGDVKRPKAIYAPEPDFPALARHAHISGTVILDAVIDEHGNVVKLRPVDGNGLLLASALKTVAQWKFEPTYLNSRPVAVEMEVTVAFHLIPR
jgi:periplasmic protein TonB